MRNSNVLIQGHTARFSAVARSGVGRLAAVVAICSVPLVLHGIFLNIPFERDEGVYATIAQGLLDGQLPYRDLFDNKTPLVYFWYAVGFVLFGEDVVAPRIMSALFLSLSTAALLAQALLVFPRRMAYIAAVLFAFSTGIPHVALHANTQPFMMLPLGASLLFFTIGVRSRNWWWLLAAGAAGGVAIMAKQPAIWNLAALAIMALWWRWSEKPGPSALAAPAAIVGGAVLSISPMLIPWLASGAIKDFVFAVVGYNFLYADGLDSLQGAFLIKRASLFILFFVAAAAPLVFGSAAGLLTVLKERKTFWLYLLLAWTLSSAIGVAMGTRFFPHYFLQLLPPMALLTALAVDVRLRDVSLGKVMNPILPAVALGLVILSTATILLLYIDPRGTERQFSDLVYHQKVMEADSPAVGAWIAERTDEDERIFVYGREAQIYFYADRLPAVRYFYDWAYVYNPQALDETIEALRREPPRFIIDTVLPPLFEPEDRAPEMEQFLSEKYEFAERVNFADVYRLREQGGG